MTADFSADLSLEAYQYSLPPARIAQNPVVPRDRARLLIIDSPTHHVHRHFYDLPQWLHSGDLLVFNNTRVIPARLYGHKAGGAAVEILLLEEQTPLRWLALVKPGKRLQPGAVILFGDEQVPQLVAQVVAKDSQTGGRVLQFELPTGLTFAAALQLLGQVPLPPYITQSQATPEQYQTVYAENPGAVAAPTAGLHFTPEVLQDLEKKGIQTAFLTLHVGLGTFRPVEISDITTHTMHAEWVNILPEVVEQIQQTKAQGGRVIAVGTTVTRALEGAAQTGPLMPHQGKTNIFIYPGYRWQVVDGLITNFHLPGSSLLMLVSALVGRSRLMQLYQEAIAEAYRFYSFGDAMLILPEGKSAQFY
ncbi:MAG: tRNA preQ1(34) S-adenosylmethionine ribosyltransferase-isomerase QueA [Leptolyngbyaceae cyanobacterium SM1_1_3]|nr:tRNA preQ1(34) S-adenosylmethionine ribosyltransferase-isomerase QueA [Leptolyngbyaceae cyanobacterium SM1_1_3]NJN01857.1 tRNA preQ1(34) S-adenosylmethionine ribosyltransferase-isomerase QueA [Leptolyngbyaceae cyanobacterium RM1_1_2]NJO10317.1 tRNA preQ1(34) S-adenosylmethionine ribosyltransferase-isomerase QueA [Leptolyngbyaceae cyanobacterium SL_1_1]